MIKVQIHQKFIPIKETIPSIFHPKFDRMKSINEKKEKKRKKGSRIESLSSQAIY